MANVLIIAVLDRITDAGEISSQNFCLGRDLNRRPFDSQSSRPTSALLLFCIHPEHNCPALSPPANGGLSSEEVAYGTVVTASCVSGFMFPDQTFTKTLACVQSDGGGNQWNDTIEDCEGITVIIVEGPNQGTPNCSTSCDVSPEPG